MRLPYRRGYAQLPESSGHHPGNIVTLYAKKTGRSEDECGTWMDETNWWTAAQAKENGFVDEVDDEESDAVVEKNRNGMLFVNSIGWACRSIRLLIFVKSRMGAKTPGGFSNATNNPGQTGTQEEEAMEIKNKDDLMKAYPDMVNEIRKDAAMDAINRERARIKDIQDMTLPGMEQTMQDALYGEHPMDATAYAKEVAKAAKKQAQNHVEAPARRCKEWRRKWREGRRRWPDRHLSGCPALHRQKEVRRNCYEHESYA